MDNIINERYEDLAKAIVLRAAGDYIGALCRLETAYDLSDEKRAELKEAASLFFESKWCAMLCPDIDGKVFIEQLDKRFNEYKKKGELEELKKLFNVNENYNFSREKKELKRLKGIV